MADPMVVDLLPEVYSYGVAISNQMRFIVWAHDLTDLGQAPAKRPSRIIGNVPEQLTEPFALMRLSSDSKVGQERPRLLGGWEFDGLAVAQHTKVTKNSNVEGVWHSCCSQPFLSSPT